MTVGEWVAAAQRRLFKLGVEAAKLEAEVLAAHVLLVDRTWIIAHPEAEFPEMAGEAVIQRRLNSEPLAYILGKRDFYGREFRVGPGVLIPRHETETLIDVALEHSEEGLKVLDLGTGSGCIAITIALERPTWKVFASDISTKALDIARANAERLNAKVEFIHANGARGIEESGFDLIVSNPPYVGLSDPLPKEIREYEPHVALYAGPAGLDFYRRLSVEAQPLLKAARSMILELGAGQLDPVRTFFEREGWTFARSKQDLIGVDRVVVFKKEEKE